MGHWHVFDRDPIDRRIELPKRFLRDCRRDRRTKSRREIILMDLDGAARLTRPRRNAIAGGNVSLYAWNSYRGIETEQPQ